MSGKVTMLYAHTDAPPPDNLIVDGSFHRSLFGFGGGFPDQTGEWDTTKTVQVIDAATVPEMTAPDGPYMVQFVASGSSYAPTNSTGCELYQLVDLTPYAARVSSGNVTARLSFDANRIAGDVTLFLDAEPEKPAMIGLEVLNNCDVSLRYMTEPGFHYSLQKSTNLTDWTTIRWGIVGTGSERTVIVAGGMIPGTYYRIGVGW